MKSLLTTFLTLSLILIMGGSRGNAEEKEAPFKFSCLYWEGVPGENLYYREGKSYQQIEFAEAARSKGLALKGMSTFELYRKAKPAAEDDPPAYQLLAQTALPSAPQVLLLIIPFEKEKVVSYKMIAMDDSLETFPRGTFRFANFTRQDLLINFAGEVEKLPSGKLTVMRCKSGEQGGFEPLLIGNSKGKTIYGTRLFGQPTSRDLAFISPPVKAGARPRVKFITELVPPSPKP